MNIIHHLDNHYVVTSFSVVTLARVSQIADNSKDEITFMTKLHNANLIDYVKKIVRKLCIGTNDKMFVVVQEFISRISSPYTGANFTMFKKNDIIKVTFHNIYDLNKFANDVLYFQTTIDYDVIYFNFTDNTIYVGVTDGN